MEKHFVSGQFGPKSPVGTCCVVGRFAFRNRRSTVDHFSQNSCFSKTEDWVKCSGVFRPMSPLPKGEGEKIIILPSPPAPLPEGEGSKSCPLPEGEGTKSCPLPKGEGTKSCPLPRGEGSKSCPLPKGKGNR